MYKVIYACMTAAAISLAALPAHANDLDGLEMDVIGIDERPDAASRRIELPEAAPRRQDEGGKDTPPGLDTASEAREQGSDVGQETAEQAREGKGPPDNVGRPDNPGDRGDDNRPDDPGEGQGNRPDDPGQGQDNRPDDTGQGNAPDRPGNGGGADSGDDMNDSPSDNRPDAGNGGERPVETPGDDRNQGLDGAAGADADAPSASAAANAEVSERRR